MQLTSENDTHMCLELLSFPTQSFGVFPRSGGQRCRRAESVVSCLFPLKRLSVQTVARGELVGSIRSIGIPDCPAKGQRFHYLAPICFVQGPVNGASTDSQDFADLSYGHVTLLVESFGGAQLIG